jgi:branched-chain amino acid transport system ATP-binding protein
MLNVKDIHTYYGNSYILQGLSFTVEKGKCVALLGRNGAGKTTTIHSIAGLVAPRRGLIEYGGQKISGLPPYRIARMGIGLVPQGRRIFPSLTVRENLVMPAREPRSAAERKAWTLEEIYGLFPVLKERENNMGNELSGGQQQMLAIGRALMTNPDFLMMDEPSEGLAPVIIEQVGEIIHKLKETGLSILLVEQNFYLACDVADEVLVMSKGQIVWQGSPQELLQDEEIQHRYLGV